MSESDPPPADADLPPSARCVLLALGGGEATRQDLLERTGLPPSTLDDALETLDKRDYIAKTRKNEDLRQVVAIPTATPGVISPESDVSR